MVKLIPTQNPNKVQVEATKDHLINQMHLNHLRKEQISNKLLNRKNNQNY